MNEWQIGLKEEGQTWMWVSGKPLTIDKWQPNEPSGDGYVFVMSKSGKGLFGDETDESVYAYICEIPQGKRRRYTGFELTIGISPVIYLKNKLCSIILIAMIY